eukprot:scaffold287_cov151-Skeletonema_marinoi.AAC.15
MPACSVLSRSRRCADQNAYSELTHHAREDVPFALSNNTNLLNCIGISQNMSMKQFSFKEAVKGNFTSRRQSSSSIMHVDGNRPQEGKDITMTVPKFSSITEEEEVDISNYTQDDLERLRLEDPFLYYSIPAMKRKLCESDKSPMNSPASSDASSRRSSCPTILLSSMDDQNSSSVGNQ